ncbi:hypothetical protein HK100_010671 [Physocladia obscura]|uniref:Uncharacterized protein n=1 Tax=Physocladia obscura TaxID=109957 RepID=A0AAD5X5L6_9FUNG|nr:hypothetical protein HK100_010671 [Physocladia obscura]
MHKCRALLYADVSVELADELLEKWGGVPRFVLENALVSEQQKKLESAIISVDLDAVVKCIGNPEGSDQVVHRLVHIHVADDFKSKVYCFASNFVAEQIYSQLFLTKRQQLIQFIAVSEGVGETGVLRGTLFERHAHDIIAGGGTFGCRQLFEKTTKVTALNADNKQITIPHLNTLLFADEQQVQASSGMYYRPHVNNYESVDSFIKPNLLFQMTSAKKHPCKQVGLNHVLELLGNPSNPTLYFVVPKDRFKEFKFQSYEDANGNTMKTPSYTNVKKIKQYVLEIDLTS